MKEDIPFPIDSEFIVEASILKLQALMESSQLCSRRLTEIYLERIYAYDRAGPRINSILEINPDALKIAETLDAERMKSGARSLLHGLPVILKDSIATADKLRTSNGSYLLQDATPREDAYVVKKLRDAGAVVLAKANMDEMACCNGISSGRGGAVRNPYILERFASGSSSGSAAAIAANLAVFALGCDTRSSIRFPASACSVVGVKPTMGLISRAGIIPADIHLDVVGPITRTVEDAAIVTNFLASKDEKDLYTCLHNGLPIRNYQTILNSKSLTHSRIGVARKGLFGINKDIHNVIERALEDLKRLGAVLIDPIEIRSIAYGDGRQQDIAILKASANWALDQYLKNLTDDSPIRSLSQLIAAALLSKQPTGLSPNFFNQSVNSKVEGLDQYSIHNHEVQEVFNRFISKQRDLVTSIMDNLDLDIIVFPTSSNFPNKLIPDFTSDTYSSACRGQSEIASYGGLPEITIPAGYTKEGLPVGISMLGRAFEEHKLFTLAYSFETATKYRKPPDLNRSPEMLDSFLPEIPVNNHFVNRLKLEGREGQISGNLLRATIEKNEPHFVTENIDRTVWFVYHSRNEGNLMLTTDKSSLRQFCLGVFCGNELYDLKLKSCAKWNNRNFHTSVTINVQAGKKYFFVLGANSFTVSSGQYILSWKILPKKKL